MGIPSNIYWISVRRLFSYSAFKSIFRPRSGSSVASIRTLCVCWYRAGEILSAFLTNQLLASAFSRKRSPPSNPKAKPSPGISPAGVWLCPKKSPTIGSKPGISVLDLYPKFTFTLRTIIRLRVRYWATSASKRCPAFCRNPILLYSCTRFSLPFTVRDRSFCKMFPIFSSRINAPRSHR
ncbi:hypothetical protein SDC9_143404 [bioreactor metagenome]|uniref:Uncharacterized protein n=1 Tax=bioreactor metagenome TaxID=1076179 RepID=A0A645E3U1_9ZZZZ